jgi:hypothetical protein
MLKVFKYPSPSVYYFSLKLPQGAKILSVQEQHGEPQVWALVNPEREPEERNFRLVTGHQIGEDEEKLSFIGTFPLVGGAFIGHLFEITR